MANSTPTKLALVQSPSEFENITDRMEMGFSQLHAFLSVAVCDDFKTYNRDINAYYLLGCRDLLTRLQADHEQLINIHRP